jgi:sulfite reductase (NADPH) flavoprotein alpha-component
MPDNAVSFWDSINQNGSSPKFDGVNYTVLALGDKNYADTFCLAGKKLDERLAELGATRIVDRVDCDVEFDDLAKEWSANAFTILGASKPYDSSDMSDPSDKSWSKKKPFSAKLLQNLPLNALH